MDELLALVHSLHEKIDAVREELDELKGQNRPMSSKDFTFTLKDTVGKNFDEWLSSLKITNEDVETLLLKSNKNCEKTDKNYLGILQRIGNCDSLRVFSNSKNSIYICKKSKWISMRKEDSEKLQAKIQSKLRERFRIMIKENNTLLDNESIKEFSYMEQRNKISQVSSVSHTIFKNDLYKILTNCTTV